MTPRPRLVLGSATLVLLVLVAALGFILHTAATLEAAEREARRLAHHEERVRLSLWRLDSILSGFLAYENARSPLASGESRPFVSRRFEIGPELATTAESVLPSYEAVVATLPDEERVMTSSPGFVWAAGATHAPSGSEPRVPVEHGAEIDGEASTDTPSIVAGNVETGTTAEEQGPREQRKSASQNEDPLLQEAETQRMSNLVEFQQRQELVSQQAQFAFPREVEAQPPIDQPVPSATDPALPQDGETASPKIRSTSHSDPIPEADPATKSVAASDLPGDPQTVSIRTGLLHPFWHEQEGGRSLFLVRRVEREGRESLQGLELDLTAVRDEMLREIQDLLPTASLEAVLDPDTADPERRLALLPLRLDPGLPQPLSSAAGWSAGRLALTTAVAAVAIAVLAGSLILLGLFRLARRRSDFASAVVHELRTPLTTFRFYTDMLAEGMVADEDRQRHAETLRREADRLGHLVENVLAYARLERRRGPSSSAASGRDLRALAEEISQRLAELAEAAGFTFQWNVDLLPDDVCLAADPLEVERILHNLCDNSCKYGRGDEARIVVSADALPERQVATIRWRDFGPGLDAAARRGLFHAFRRGHSEGTPGIGLGLALSRQLARGFGGDLRPLRIEGAGSVFELTLPIRTHAVRDD
ncbi:MAG: HAMP domain-containing histidine kinase [Thermoanaerobaculia bacterium]|nr:HAMP domain-containing histidine kinase [Thermoanaerobaculia bacterium]